MLERAVLDMINEVLPTSVIVFLLNLYLGNKQDTKKLFLTIHTYNKTSNKRPKKGLKTSPQRTSLNI